VTERALAVLNALLTFPPETALTGEDDLVVFPSNQLLSLRAHGMPASTLRRHLAALVDAGLIIRRDSPNGKRYARMDEAGCPFCFTIDSQTLEDQTVTVRHRDTLDQERIAIDKVCDFLAEKLGF